MKNTFDLVKTFIRLVAFAAFIATTSHAKTEPDCCGSGEDVYTPSTQRIKIMQSPELKKQLAALKSKPAELARMRKAIDVGNKLIQGHVNGDLYVNSLPPTNFPPPSTVYEDGWKKNFGPLVSVGVEEFRALRQGERPNGTGQHPPHKRFNNLVCPFGQLADIFSKDGNIYLTYRLLHIARPSTTVFHRLDESALDVSDNNTIQALHVSLDSGFKFLPVESINREWWYTTNGTVLSYKQDLKYRERTNFGFEKDKPNLRKLILQITEAEKVCNKPHPFQ